MWSDSKDGIFKGLCIILSAIVKLNLTNKKGKNKWELHSCIYLFFLYPPKIDKISVFSVSASAPPPLIQPHVLWSTQIMFAVITGYCYKRVMAYYIVLPDYNNYNYSRKTLQNKRHQNSDTLQNKRSQLLTPKHQMLVSTDWEEVTPSETLKFK